MSYLKKYSLPILSGILVGTSYIPFPAWALLFCLAPLFYFWYKSESYKEIFWGSWWTQFILNIIGFHWVYTVSVEFGHFPKFMGVLCVILFGATAHLYFCFSAVVWFYLKKKLKPNLFIQAFLMWILFCIFQKYTPCIFPWHLGYPWLFHNLPGAQIGDWIGFEGLSYLSIGFSVILAFGFFHKISRNLSIASVVFIFGFINLVGYLHQKNLNPADKTFPLIIVQGNIGNTEKMYAEHGRGFQQAIIQKYLDLSREALQKFANAKLLVWPETAVADHLDSLFKEQPNNVLLRNFLQNQKVYLITGAYHEEIFAKKVFNSIFLLDSNGQNFNQIYSKQKLLIFGEYVPLSKYFPQVLKWLEIFEFGRGSGAVALQLEDVKFGPQICYEALYPLISKQSADLNAQILINTTNDSWYGAQVEPFQHLYMTAARAVEFRRPLIRATNTGISTVVDSNGALSSTSSQNSEWYGFYEVPYSSQVETTLYQKFFYQWDIFLFLTLGLLIVSCLFRKK